MRKILFLFFGCISFTLISAAQTATVAKDSVAIQNAQNDTAQVDTKESLSRKELDKIAKALKPVEGKALVYIVRPSGMGD